MGTSFYGSLVKILQKYITPRISQEVLANILLLAPTNYGKPEWATEEYEDYEISKSQASKICSGKQNIPQKILGLYSATDISERIKNCIVNQIIKDIQKGRERQFLNDIFVFIRDDDYLTDDQKNVLLKSVQDNEDNRCLRKYENIDFEQSDQKYEFSSFLAEICIIVINCNNDRLEKMSSGQAQNHFILIPNPQYERDQSDNSAEQKKTNKRKEDRRKIIDFIRIFNFNNNRISIIINFGACAFFGCIFLGARSDLPPNFLSKISIEINGVSFFKNNSFTQSGSPQIEEITTSVGEGQSVYLSPGGVVDPGIEVIPQDADKKNISSKVDNEQLVKVTQDLELMGRKYLPGEYENETNVIFRAGGVEPVNIHVVMSDTYNGNLKDGIYNDTDIVTSSSE